jgi:glycine hydroxymethyltransferase
MVGAKLMVDIAHIAAWSPPDFTLLRFRMRMSSHRPPIKPSAAPGRFHHAREEYGPAIDAAVFPGIQGGPMMHTIAAKAVAFHEPFNLSSPITRKRSLRTRSPSEKNLKNSACNWYRMEPIPILF